jgi:hypothetical protein
MPRWVLGCSSVPNSQSTNVFTDFFEGTANSSRRPTVRLGRVGVMASSERKMEDDATLRVPGPVNSGIGEDRWCNPLCLSAPTVLHTAKFTHHASHTRRVFSLQLEGRSQLTIRSCHCKAVKYTLEVCCPLLSGRY